MTYESLFPKPTVRDWKRVFHYLMATDVRDHLNRNVPCAAVEFYNDLMDFFDQLSKHTENDAQCPDVVNLTFANLAIHLMDVHDVKLPGTEVLTEAEANSFMLVMNSLLPALTVENRMN